MKHITIANEHAVMEEWNAHKYTADVLIGKGLNDKKQNI